MKVLHVFYQSYPNISGSSTRSYDIVHSQLKEGIEPIILTSPFQKGFSIQYGPEEIEDLIYYRTYNNKKNQEVSENGNNLIQRIGKLFSILTFYFEIKKIAKLHKVDVIHSHAMFFCGLPSILVARKLKIPHLYEVRSLWEERKRNLNPKNIFVKFEYYVIKYLESLTMKNSDHVIVINKNLEQDLIARKIDKNKISVIHNAVNFDFILKQKSKYEVVEDNQKRSVLGYIGSISPIEGLDDLISVVKDLNEELDVKIQLLIFGGGKQSEISKITQLISDDKNITFCGNIPRNEIYKAYQKVDIIVNPRKKSKLTDSVTPLKPLEAMGFEKLVLASDVGGMKELIEDKLTGFLFKSGSQESLKLEILNILNLSNSEYLKIKKAALENVTNLRSWNANARNYLKIYKLVIKN